MNGLRCEAIAYRTFSANTPYERKRCCHQRPSRKHNKIRMKLLASSWAGNARHHSNWINRVSTIKYAENTIHYKMCLPYSVGYD